MLKFVNAFIVTSIVVLSFVSCSILRPQGGGSSIAEPNIPAEISVDTLQSDTLQCDHCAVDSLAMAAEPIAADSVEMAYIAAEELIIEQEDGFEDLHELFHFEGSQTTAVMIDEFRNSVVEDLVIDLSQENSFYPADGHVTSNYGWRKSRMHGGIDLKAYTGDNLYAAFDGVVRLSKYYSSFGNCIIIRHYNGLETLYAHASKRFVEVNDVVKAGDVIALAGNTGRSTGSHLHFEVRVGGNHFDPRYILDTNNRKIKDANLYITMRNGRLFASNNDSEQEREAYILQQISIRYYTVRSGDNLSRIAANNGTTVATLCRLNGISSKSILRIGQRLIVRDGIKPTTTTTTAATSTTTTTTTTKSTTSSPATPGATEQYKVKSGDNLTHIAKRYNTTVTELCALNNISSRSTLRVGQILLVPSTGGSAGSSTSSPATAASSSTAPQYHIVKSGDTLSHIAQRYGTTVSKICKLNNISSTSTLRIKQKLQVK